MVAIVRRLADVGSHPRVWAAAANALAVLVEDPAIALQVGRGPSPTVGVVLPLVAVGALLGRCRDESCQQGLSIQCHVMALVAACRVFQVMMECIEPMSWGGGQQNSTKACVGLPCGGATHEVRRQRAAAMKF